MTHSAFGHPRWEELSHGCCWIWWACLKSPWMILIVRNGLQCFSTLGQPDMAPASGHRSQQMGPSAHTGFTQFILICVQPRLTETLSSSSKLVKLKTNVTSPGFSRTNALYTFPLKLETLVDFYLWFFFFVSVSSFPIFNLYIECKLYLLAPNF